MAKIVENKYRQAVPLLYKEPVSGALKLYILKDREVKQFDDDEISQDITDKGTASIIAISEAGD